MSDAKDSLQTDRTTLGRFAFRGRYDRETVHAILDEAFLCHVGYVRDGQPFVTPTSFWRIDDTLYWHGSAESSMLRSATTGIPVCFTVSHVDGLVLSRVMSRHSFNYRSVVVLGRAEAVTDPAEKLRGMHAFVDRILPGRWDDGVMPVTPTDIERITIARMDLREASAKVRGGPPKDSPLHFQRTRGWAGHVPFKLAIGRAVADANLPDDIALPDYVRSLAHRFGAEDLCETEFEMPVFAAPETASPPRATGRFSIELLDSGRVVESQGRQTILAAALEAGLDYPFGCAAGGCASCKTRLVSGSVEMLAYERAALTDAEREAGWILACCAVPTSDLAVVPKRDEAASHSPMPGKVVSAERATHDVVRLRLSLDDAPPLAFLPGQFARLSIDGLPEREYSFAGQSGTDLLEFHVRVMPDGVVSSHIGTQVRAGASVLLRGPFGVAHLREDDLAPIVAIAGGTGLAPMRSIIDRLLTQRPDAVATLYFGVRDERDLYDLEHFEALSRLHRGFRFLPVLSAPSAPNGERRTGFVADALLRDEPELRSARVYMAGPPIMIETVTAAALRLGAQPDRIHADAFLTAVDKAARSHPSVEKALRS